MFRRFFRFETAAAVAGLIASTLVFGASHAAVADDIVQPQISGAESAVVHTECLSDVNALLDDTVVAAAVDQSGSDAVNYVCADNAVSVEATQAKASEELFSAVKNTDTGVITDLTGLSDAEVAEAAVPVVLDAPEATPVTPQSYPRPASSSPQFIFASTAVNKRAFSLASTTVNTQYRSSGSTIIDYGQVSNQGNTFHAQIRVSMLLSLVFVKHTVQISYTPLSARPVSVQIPIRMQRVAWPFDQTVDSTVANGGTSSTSSYTSPLMNIYTVARSTDKYYVEQYNTVLLDRFAGRFNVVASFRLPTFQCYKTVQCKYPNGRAA
ncbi:hypothetical protein E3O55_09840 [Cryobacterium sp. MDB1-18-2]|uniref:hypothetical protein n=1 Tax=unclassified Cryobacterium TaxID=2649013 RepID=UPI001069A7EB|nr:MULTISPECIES: hypothetical protein [unclassified Cryobacterium]TFC29166.1 hypothetical protein E3O55_09840 [Cryobacterium sp. MDB1-18-2]TFC45528.1 hypothetical protein E3O50_03510 [Cryobacterium sp. MDB1-18-1]